ncbi:MAG: FtsW/RodA/SpoVE family cell cycle protein [Candidatus Fermentibacteraceae bacterium]|nr:FtsW/RodA/SpoVE family cell cycle protein [Candidatus Fermentibacteraceae bacterium]
MRYVKPAAARNAMLLAAALLLIFGTLAVFTASSFKSLLLTGSESSTLFLVPHLKKILAGVIVGLLLYSVPQEALKRSAPYFYGLSLALLAGLLVLKGTRWAPVINGSARWLTLPGGFRIMPSEIARITYVLLAASLVSSGTIRARTGPGVSWLTLLAVVPAALVAMQPDFAGGMYILMVMAVVLFLAESRFRDMLVLFLIMLAFASVVVFSSDYRRERLVSWFSPGDAAEASTYQPEQACIALGSGGLMGRGIGRGRQQRGFLPEAFSDYILAVIGEETGFLGVLLILAMLFLMLMSGWLIADGADHLFGYLVSGGLMASIALGMFIHIAVVTRMFPSTGMPLPLVSWGGSNLMITLGSLGIVSRVAREGGGK